MSAIQTGNANLYGEGQWTGTPETADGTRVPLPVYPKQSDLPPSAPTIREGLAAFACSLLTLSSFVGVFVIAAYTHGWRW